MLCDIFLSDVGTLQAQIQVQIQNTDSRAVRRKTINKAIQTSYVEAHGFIAHKRHIT